MKKFAQTVGAKTFCFNARHNAPFDVLMMMFSEYHRRTFPRSDFRLRFLKNRNAVIWNKLRQAAKAGAKIIVVNTPETQTSFDFAEKVIDTDNSTSFLKGMAKALIDMGKTSDIEGFDEFAKSVADAQVCDEIKAAAEAYANAKKAMIVFQQNVVSEDAAALIADIALLSGHIGTPRDGILEVKAKNNSQDSLIWESTPAPKQWKASRVW